MTQKNGTIEFIKEDGQAPNLYIREYKKLVSFDHHSKKYFTCDPIIIKALDANGYKRGKIKIDGIAVLAKDMTDDEIKRVEKNLKRESEKVNSETPVVDVEDITEEIKDSIKEDQEVCVKLDDKDVAEKITEKKIPKRDKVKKKASSKLKKEIGNK